MAGTHIRIPNAPAAQHRPVALPAPAQQVLSRNPHLAQLYRSTLMGKPTVTEVASEGDVTALSIASHNPYTNVVSLVTGLSHPSYALQYYDFYGPIDLQSIGTLGQLANRRALLMARRHGPNAQTVAGLPYTPYASQQAVLTRIRDDIAALETPSVAALTDTSRPPWEAFSTALSHIHPHDYLKLRAHVTAHHDATRRNEPFHFQHAHTITSSISIPLIAGGRTWSLPATAVVMRTMDNHGTIGRSWIFAQCKGSDYVEAIPLQAPAVNPAPLAEQLMLASYYRQWLRHNRGPTEEAMAATLRQTMLAPGAYRTESQILAALRDYTQALQALAESNGVTPATPQPPAASGHPPRATRYR